MQLVSNPALRASTPTITPAPNVPASWVNPEKPLAVVSYHIKNFGDADFHLIATGVVTPSSTTSDPAFDRIEGSFNDAVRAAVKAARGTGIEQLQAILQGTDGAYYLTSVDNTKEGHYVAPGFIDGDRMKAIDWDRVSGRSENPAMQALVGAYTLIDLRRDGKGDRKRLPKLS
ncbi:MAG: hypothetical protein H7123_06990 [Thermoleophilia bacterium]|nr:hypothetical protein [Thermoleophilia bacterium]